MKFSLKQDKGVAGLTILLSLVVMMFIIGLIVMIFTLMGAEMSKSTYDTVEVSLELGFINATTYTLTNLGVDGNPSITSIVNNTAGAETISSSDYTITAGIITNATSTVHDDVNISYSYQVSNSATNVMNDTTSAISSVTDWFSIFIVIGAMVVLILLTVIIITAIRGSGMIEGVNSTSGGRGNVGSA